MTTKIIVLMGWEFDGKQCAVCNESRGEASYKDPSLGIQKPTNANDCIINRRLIQPGTDHIEDINCRHHVISSVHGYCKFCSSVVIGLPARLRGDHLHEIRELFKKF